MNIGWSSGGLEALMRLDPLEAARVDRAVTEWATTGVGLVHAIDGGAFHLYVSSYVVFFFDDTMDVMHVDHVRRA